VLSKEAFSGLPRHLERLVAGRLWLKVIIAMALGIGVGLVLGPSVGWIDPKVAALIGDWLALPGQLFLGSIQMIVVPLVVASIVRGLADGEDVEQLRKLGIRLAGYFVLTTTVAVTIGVGLATLLKPGRFVASSEMFQSSTNLPVAGQPIEPASIPDLVTSILPVNPLGAMVEGQMLQVVLFSVIFGVALIAMQPKQAQPILDLFESLQEVCMTVVRWAMRLAPIAVFGLVAQVAMTLGVTALTGLAAYVGTVLLGLLILLVLYTTLSAVVGKRSPRAFLRSIRDVQLLAFSTSSSAAVMPLSIQTAEEQLDVRPSVAQLVVPLGATINMDGTAMYQAIATVFLAQVTGIDLGLGALVLIVVTAVGASIGASSTPGVGIVLLASILQSAGIPVGAIALILGVDRILDMSRTAVNVTGDLTACVVMNRWVGDPKGEELDVSEEGT
tara:strand:+ start:37696 stop:39027 length:1332 start_codon:yes stop_codon:yes gene_type:complete